MKFTAIESLSLGFDTASSIAILAISAIAKHSSDGKGIKPAHIVILPVRNLVALFFGPTHPPSSYYSQQE